MSDTTQGNPAPEAQVDTAGASSNAGPQTPPAAPPVPAAGDPPPEPTPSALHEALDAIEGWVAHVRAQVRRLEERL